MIIGIIQNNNNNNNPNTFTIDWVMPRELTRRRGAGDISLVWCRASATTSRLVTLSSFSMSLSISHHRISPSWILCRNLLVHMALSAENYMKLLAFRWLVECIIWFESLYFDLLMVKTIINYCIQCIQLLG